MRNSNTKIVFPCITYLFTAIILSFIVCSNTAYGLGQIEIHQENYIKTDTLDKDLSTSNLNVPKNAVQKFELTRSIQEYIVPDCVTKVIVYMWGAGGAGGDVSNQNAKTHGGGGGFVEGELDVTPGEKLLIIVGQGGRYGNTNSNTVIYGGGGLGGYQGGYTGTGGGRSEIRRNNTVIATAGAGGGGGESRGNSGQEEQKLGGVGGAGGGIKGRHGSRGQGYLTPTGTEGGKGGTQSTGGIGGIGSSNSYNGSNGLQFEGGRGSNNSGREGGGGGGGYYGGGGGAGQGSNNNGAAGGGGGSSYIGGLTNASTIAGGDGDLPGNSQQKAAEENHQYNQKNYGRGADVSSDGQNGLIVIKVIEKENPNANVTTADFTACHGSTVEVSGNVDVDGPWSLTLSDNSVINGNGPGTWSADVTPTSTDTYDIIGLTNNVNGNCPSSFSGSTEITLPNTNKKIANNGQSATCYVKGNNYVHFYHTSGRLIGSINPNGEDLGLVTMTMFKQSNAEYIPACGSSNPTWGNTVMKRNWLVTQTNIPSVDVDVRLPFKNANLTQLKNAANNNQNPNDDLGGINDVRLSKYNGSNENGDAADNCGNGTTLVYTQTSNGDINLSNSFVKEVNNGKYVQFTIPGFSELWLHGSTNSPLPVKLTDLSAECSEEITINWTTASESNSDQFIVEKSRDGVNWSFVGSKEAAGNSNTEINYFLNDKNASNGIRYYRLRQIDFDGVETIYGPLSVSCSEGNTSISVFPNPSNGQFTVELISEEKADNAMILLMDFNGKIIEQKELDIKKGENLVFFDQYDLSQGFYLIKVIGLKEQIAPVKFLMK